MGLVSGRNSTQQPIAVPMTNSVVTTKVGGNHDALQNRGIEESMPLQPSPEKRRYRNLAFQVIPRSGPFTGDKAGC
jgi:hypothetical protein